MTDRDLRQAPPHEDPDARRGPPPPTDSTLRTGDERDEDAPMSEWSTDELEREVAVLEEQLAAARRDAVEYERNLVEARAVLATRKK